MKKIVMALVLSFTIAQMAFAATVDTGYMLSGVNGMTGIEMANGQMVTVWNGGYTMKMINDTTLANGTVVMPNGYVLMATGATTWMKNGESMDLTGNITNIGNGVLPPPMAFFVSGLRTVTTALFVRSQPNMNNNHIGFLMAGTIVTVKSKSSNGFWCSINYKNYNSAWVACRYLAQ